MRPRTDALRDALAAEYVLGTLHGRARQRMERLLQVDPELRRRVHAWRERLAPLDAATAPVSPPGQVWPRIAARIGARARPGTPAWWDSLPFWRGTALASFVLAGVLAAVLGALSPRTPEMMVVVMSDQSQRPAMTVSWQPEDRGRKQLRVRVHGHAEMGPETAWELWMLRSDGRPLSLGLITTHETQTVLLPAELAAMVDTAQALAMSVEPKGGSPTGLPTGPILYQGPCTKL
jgi:anti-sigma-K factor RskA